MKKQIAFELPPEKPMSIKATLLQVLSNAAPVIAVLTGAPPFYILLYYWVESGVAGLFNIPRMIRHHWIFSIFLVPFFIVHYGLFMFVHLIFLVLLFARDAFFVEGGSLPFDAHGLINVFLNDPYYLIFLIGLYLYRFIKDRQPVFSDTEKRINACARQMFIPYKRIVALHITIIGSAFLVWDKFTPLVSVGILAGIKIITDFAIDWGSILKSRKNS